VAARKKTPTKKAEPQTTQFDKAEALLELAKSLSPKERAKLAAEGLYVPERVDVEPRFGYRCTSCNEVALYLGDEEGMCDHEGERLSDDKPDILHLEKVSWAWNGEGRFNPAKPTCQCCGAPQRMILGGLPGKHIVEIAPWREARDAGLKAQHEARRFNRWGVDQHMRQTTTIKTETGSESINDSMPFRKDIASGILDAFAQELDSRGVNMAKALREGTPRGGLAPSGREREPAPELDGRRSFIDL
jgi:hypothetical protein